VRIVGLRKDFTVLTRLSVFINFLSGFQP